MLRYASSPIKCMCRIFRQSMKHEIAISSRVPKHFYSAFYSIHSKEVPKSSFTTIYRYKHDVIDKSKVPILNEDDLEEWFVAGSGPGGQNVNKRTNACSLRHKPTGIIVKVHLSRELHINRKTAREMMIEKLDDFYNGEDSVKAQRERILERKSKAKEIKARKSSELKKKYKELLEKSETVEDSNSSSNNNLSIDGDSRKLDDRIR